MHWVERYLALLSGSQKDKLEVELEREKDYKRKAQLEEEVVVEQGKSLLVISATHAVALALVKSIEVFARKLRDERKQTEPTTRDHSTMLPGGSDVAN